MRRNEQYRMPVMDALKKLQSKGTKAEHIAVMLGMSYDSVQAWKAGRRVPVLPIIRQLEHVYGLKIL